MDSCPVVGDCGAAVFGADVPLGGVAVAHATAVSAQPATIIAAQR
jgi:hypothetical protein